MPPATAAHQGGPGLLVVHDDPGVRIARPAHLGPRPGHAGALEAQRPGAASATLVAPDRGRDDRSTGASGRLLVTSSDRMVHGPGLRNRLGRGAGGSGRRGQPVAAPGRKCRRDPRRHQRVAPERRPKPARSSGRRRSTMAAANWGGVLSGLGSCDRPYGAGDGGAATSRLTRISSSGPRSSAGCTHLPPAGRVRRAWPWRSGAHPAGPRRRSSVRARGCWTPRAPSTPRTGRWDRSSSTASTG